MANITLKQNPIHTNGNLPHLRLKAPDFLLVDSQLHNRSLKDYGAKRKLLSIVPSLDTPVCLNSTKKFNDWMKAHPEIIALVISADLPFAQKRMCSQEHIANITPLSMMRNQEFAKAYGILIEDGPLAGICARAIVVLSEDNHVLYTELIPEVTQEPDYDLAFEVLLQS